MIQYKRWVSMAVVATTVTVMTLGVNTQAAEHHTEMMYASDHMEIVSFAQLLQDSERRILRSRISVLLLYFVVKRKFPQNSLVLQKNGKNIRKMVASFRLCGTMKNDIKKYIIGKRGYI